jgi:hypothetical protein
LIFCLFIYLFENKVSKISLWCGFVISLWSLTFFIFFLFLLLCHGYIVAFTKVLTLYQIYHTLIHPLHHSPLTSTPLIPEIASTGLTFPFTYMCTQYFLCYIHPPTSFSHMLPLPLVPTSPLPRPVLPSYFPNL